MTARDDAAGLRERVEALAEEWGITGEGFEEEFAEAIGDSGAWRFARELRALLAESTPAPAPAAGGGEVEAWCIAFHDAYEAAAVEAGWETQQRSRKPWADVPEENKATMRATIRAILAGPLLADIRRTARAEGAREALRVVRLVEADMAEVALKAWRAADARRGLSDHDALLTFADALTRWSERFRMAFDGEDYRAENRATGGPQ